MSTTTLSPGAARQRLPASTSSSSVASSANISPADTPQRSSSATSLSSLAAEDDHVPSKLVDTMGNPFSIPDYTIGDIHRAIPKHCFERSALRGLGYVARDFVSLGVTFYLAHNFVTPEYVPSTAVRAGLWALYTVLQGLFATGLWILAHECGHQAFSPSKTLNDTVGWICHSVLLVPYFSWKLSHSKHHKATGHMEREMVFMPKTRERYAARYGYMLHELSELAEETPIVTALHVLYQQLGGWPAYLFLNVTGHNNHEKQSEGRGKGKANGVYGGVNHFNPSSPLYDAKEAKLILLSDLGLLIVSSILYTLAQKFGWTNVLVWYIIPYLWVNHWLVAITFLQHTDPTLPHYTPSSWTYVRGAAATIDREFGFIGRTLLHGIVETHVLHHYVSTIPFYHADEATEAIKPVMGKHYRSDTRDGSLGFLRSLWTSMRHCQWVEAIEGTEGDEAGVLFYRNRNGVGMPPATLSPVQ